MKYLSVVESFTRPISVIVLSPEADDSVVDSGSSEPRGRCQKATHETKYHHLFAHNFFHQLSTAVITVTEDNLAATGIIREVKTGGAHQKLVKSKEMKKKGTRVMVNCVRL